MPQLRNISCTPLFSKLLESFVLDLLREQTKLSNDQYGGLKGVSADHFLIGTWQTVLDALEDPRAAASLLSIDLEKAFNRLCHGSCLRSLENLGADDAALGLVHAFLQERTMSVKLGETFSRPRLVPGGSPQGSILGNYLFCATSDSLTQDVDYSRQTNESLSEMSETGNETFEGEAPVGLGGVGPDWNEPEDGQERPEDVNGSADGSLLFHRRRLRHEFDSSSDDEVGGTNVTWTQTQIDAEFGVPADWNAADPSIFVYIDDANGVKKVRIQDSISNISQNKQLIKIHAEKSEELLNTVTIRAAQIGMKVNHKKPNCCVYRLTKYLKPLLM